MLRTGTLTPLLPSEQLLTGHPVFDRLGRAGDMRFRALGDFSAPTQSQKVPK